MNREIILVTHGKFSEGILDSINIILGKQDNLHAISAYTDDKVDFKEKLHKIVDDIEDKKEIIICTDIYGGTVSNAVLELLENENIHLITGLNLTLLLYILRDEEESIQNVIDTAIEESRKGILYFKRK